MSCNDGDLRGGRGERSGEVRRGEDEGAEGEQNSVVGVTQRQTDSMRGEEGELLGTLTISKSGWYVTNWRAQIS